MLRHLPRVLMLIGLAMALPGPAPAQEGDLPRIAPRPLASALNAVRGDRWDMAARLAARAGPAAEDMIEWYRLRAGQGRPDEVLAFLRRNGDWPGLPDLRRRNEEVMTKAALDDVLEFYEGHAPQTGTGALNHARALSARGRVGEAEAGLVLAWRTMDLTTAEHDAFLQAHGDLLAPHHAARLDMALWRGLRDVEQMLPLVDAETRVLADTRRTIAAGGDGVAELIDELPDAARRAPGIAHEIFNHHLRTGHADRAIEVILRQSRIPDGLGEPDRWAGWRRALTRSQMRDGNPEQAYELAAIHQLVEGSNYADLEWLSGYLALRYLDAPGIALDHFQRLREAVETPISLGRAGYWIGRALEALDDPESARIAYEQAAEHRTSFYGLLAAERADLPPDPALSGEATAQAAPWREADFTRSGVYRAAILALASDRLTLAEQFIVHLSQSQDRDGLERMGAMLAELDEPHLQVMLGKAAARRGIVLPAPYYALHPMTEMDLPVPMELALAIARRESEFDFLVVSGAGARGLMQLMPGTASDVARQLQLDHDPARVMADWRYNTRLGAAYLADLAERFGGNVVMMAAGYNAGPGRPRQWMERFGDPRAGGVINGEMDVIDWIEHIPFNETRNYVMRVAESLPVYRARLGKDPHPVPFSDELVGATLLSPG